MDKQPKLHDPSIKFFQSGHTVFREYHQEENSMDFQESKTKEALFSTLSDIAVTAIYWNYCAEQAKKEGYPQIAAIFETSARHQLAHAERIFSFLGKVSSTKENLCHAAAQCQEKWAQAYPSLVETAREEGFLGIAAFYRRMTDVKLAQENLFRTMAARIEGRTLYKDQTDTIWNCLRCGHVHHGAEPPLVCPLCHYERGYFIRQ